MSTLTQEPISSGQKRLLTRMIGDVAGSDDVEGALDALSKEGAERLKGSPEFIDSVRQFVIKKISELSVSSQFADEEVGSSYGYPPEHKGPRPITEQITTLAKIFDLDPSRALAYAKDLPELPAGAEGWFAIPSLAALGKKHFPEITIPAEEYCQAVQLVHQKIAASRKFTNYREGQITPAHLRIQAQTAVASVTLAEQQPGDILIIAGQLGLRHRGRSVRRAREVFVQHEAGLTSLMAGAIVLTHPKRLVRSAELDLDCAGDEFASGANGVFSKAPHFSFSDRAEFVTVNVGSADGFFGPASFFLPPQ